MPHHEPNLVDVSIEQDAGRIGGRPIEGGPGRAVGVAVYGIGVGADVLGPHALTARLKPGGTGSIEQIEEKGLSVRSHAQEESWRNQGSDKG